MPTVPKIAIIDDERDLVRLTEKRLRAGGFEVASYMEGNGAYEFICREKPDLVLLDIWLPDVSGLEIFKRLRASRELKKIPVLFFSAHVSKKDDCVDKLGADGFIKKPYNPHELISLVKKALDGTSFPAIG
ncbi:MAG: response regulator [Deltaproteobacteria bacterium]|nr:response regulator [Deltaproteobacteria bacterium]